MQLPERCRRRAARTASRRSGCRWPTRGRSTTTTPWSPPQWYDLCPDGTVALAVEQRSLHGNQHLELLPYRSWYWTAGAASATLVPGPCRTPAPRYPGVYYVYGANAEVGANGNSAIVQTVSVWPRRRRPSGFTDSDTCDKYGGDITWKLFDIQNYLRGVVFIAQGSLYGSANSTAQAGLMLAGDKVDLQTSSATVKGSVIANNTCAAAGANEIQGMTVTYDESVEAPVYSVVNTTLWLEYIGQRLIGVPAGTDHDASDWIDAVETYSRRAARHRRPAGGLLPQRRHRPGPCR